MKQTANQNLLPHQTTTSRSVWQAWLLLAIGLIATAVAAFYVKTDVEADAKHEFDFACNEIRLKIEARLNAHAQILRSGAALFDASDDVTREKWHTFTKRQKVEQKLPGIQGIGFSLLIPYEQLEQHIQQIRSQGFPEYNVKPEGRRETYTSIIYLEPFSGRNLRAFGYDMFSESVRRIAMEMARDTDSAALSGKVILVQETDKDVQTGTLMYVPVYRKGMPTDTVEQRRAALYGWVYSPYRMNDLMEGILGGWGVNDENQIRLRVFDGAESALLFDSQPGKESDSAALLYQSLPIDFAGRRWTLHFIRTNRYTDFTELWLTIAGGTTISLLLFGLLLSLINTRFRARQIADRLTVDLRDSEERYKRLSDLTFEGILFHQNGLILDCNQSFVNLMGYSREELLGQHVLSVLVPEKYHPIVRQNMIKKTAEPYEVELLRKNAILIPVELRARNIVSEGKEMRVVAARDISKRKKVEDRLHNALLYTRSLIEASIDPFFTINPDGRISDVNTATEIITGYLREDLIGTDFSDYFTESEKAKAVYTQVFNTGSVHDYELNLQHKTGKITPVLYNASVYRDESGKIIGVFAAARDITKRRQMEEELIHAKARAEERSQAAEAANHAKGEFIAHISHELRTPLNGILGYTQILKRDNLTDKQSEEIAIIHRGAEHLLMMINDLLDFSRIEAGKLEFGNADIDLPEFLKTTADIASVQAMQKGIAFILETSAEIPQKVCGDEKRLRQVLLNLLGNAIKFTENGSVVFNTGLNFSDQKHVLIHFQVKDTGIGIPADQIEKIFEPFHQVNTIGKNEGTGLGLAICRKLVRSMSSELYVNSVEGHGSEFWFEIKLLRIGTEIIHSEKTAALPEKPEQDMIAAPPKEKLVRLLELLKRGDVIAIQKYAEQLKISDSEFAIFGEKVYQLAKKLQLKKIKLMILECMENEI